MSKHIPGKKRHAAVPSPVVHGAGTARPGAPGRTEEGHAGSTSGPRPAGAPGARPSPTPEEIAARAYELWQVRGRPEGDGLEDWFEAERQLRGGPAIDIGAQRTAPIATARPGGPTGTDPGGARATGPGRQAAAGTR